MAPQFETLSAFFAMGGHALYVWLAYGATALVLAGNYWVIRQARKRQLERLRWQANTQQAQRAPADSSNPSPGES